ncbi:MAG TPA: hypothetical protein VG796_05640 [Verrucomicrobiales bacterium]|nr:hypothetical protein [Verrucomicrobiales bacterium]
MTRVHRSIISTAVVIAALVLGLGAGEALSGRIWPETTNKKSGVLPVSSNKAEGNAESGKAGALSGMSPDEFHELQQAVRGVFSGAAGAVRSNHDVLTRIAAGLSSGADCARAAELIDSAPPNLRHTLTNIIFRRWAALDPAAALRAADGLKTWQSQRRGAETVLKIWAQQDAVAALKAATSAPPGFVRDRGVSYILYTLAKDDPVRGLELLSHLPKPDHAAFYQVLNAWAAKEPRPAWEWLKSQSDPVRREQAARAVLSGMAANGQHKEALTLAEQQPEGRTRLQMISGVMEAWIRKDPTAALSNASKLPAGEFTAEMAYSLVRSAFNILDGYAAGAPDPKKWADAFITKFPAGPQREAVRAAMAVHVMTFNLGREFQAQKALPLLADMEEGPWKARATADLAAAWTHTDAVAASEWLASLPPSRTRDAAVARFVERISLSDPERAKQWAETIRTP